jgi:hypothetical protein
MEITPAVSTDVGVSMEVEQLALPTAPKPGSLVDAILSEEQFAQLEIESEVNGYFNVDV